MYGARIETQNGMENIADLLSIRLADSFSANQSSGSYTAPSFWNPSHDGFFVVPHGDTVPPQLIVDGRSFSWSVGSGSTASFTLYLFFSNSTMKQGGYGVGIYNQNQNVVLDHTYAPFSIIGRGDNTGFITDTTLPNSGYTHQIACSQGDIVFATLDNGQSVTSGTYSNGERTLYHSAQNISYLIAAHSPGTPSGVTYGMRIRNAQGDVIYDSRVPVLSVRSVSSGKPEDGFTVSGLSSADRYVACYGPAWIWIATTAAGGGGQELYQGGLQYYGVRRDSNTSLKLQAINGPQIMGSPYPVYGPIPNNARISAIVGRG